MRVRVLYHDHCFDGAASAAFFSRFIQGAFYPDAEFVFTGMAHKASQLFDPALFDGDENAIVDFKYSPDPRLTWWFDHHQSAFLSPEDAGAFPAGPQRARNSTTPASNPAPCSSARWRAESLATKRKTCGNW